MTATFETLVTRCPRPHEPDRVEAVRSRFSDLSGPVRDLIAATSACSGYLRGLIEREADWLREAVAQPPDQTMQSLLRAAQGQSPDDLAKALRKAKGRGALLTALADLGGVWALEEVTGALTDLADTAVDRAMKALLAVEIRRGKLPGCSEEDIESGAGLFALAMGKMGAGELNYSSDIDLIMLFDETRFDPVDYGEARQCFVRVTQKLVKMLSQHTGDGYVFRTDLRLRPDPSSTPVVIAAEAAENYYESLGRTWERAAYIKARPCAGDIAAGEAFLKRLSPFVWRRHLDYAAIEDAYDMLERIRSHKGLAGPISVPGHNVKLGRGGIREIEFFAQTRQLILGGRNPQFRDRRTLPTLDALAREGWVDGATVTALSAAYRRLRATEHRLQMLEDAQTHRLPATEEGLSRCADLGGFDSTADFVRTLAKTFEAVHALTEPFFAPDARTKDNAPSVWEVFSEPEKAEAIISGWSRIPALRTERARSKFRRLEPELLRRIAKAPDADEALRSLDAFLRRLPAGVQLFALMEANPQLLDLLVDICGTAQALAHYLGSNAGVLDAVISQDFFGNLRTVDALRTELRDVVDRSSDYEAALNATRVWSKERHFRIGVHLLRGLADPDEAAAAYSSVAEAVVDVLLPRVTENFAERHGSPPGSEPVVLAMGKFGSREMTVSSDLDLIMIYEAESAAMSDGKRPLAATAYYARLTQSLISALTAPMPEGVLYKVDMRLRPSGRQGPLATNLAAFRTYQAREAWTWEHLALTRSRTVAGPRDLREAVDHACREAIAAPRETAKILEDVRDMRRRLAEAHEKDASNPWTTKKGPGRMMDIELLAQAGALIHGITGIRRPGRLLEKLARIGWLDADQGSHLIRSLGRLGALQQVSRLASNDETVEPADRGEGFVKLALRVTGAPDIETLRETLVAEARRCDEIIGKRLSDA